MTTSLPELTAELRRTRPAAPPAVREHVRKIAARRREPSGRRIALPSLTLRRSLAVLVPAAIAVVVGGIVLSGGGRQGDRETAVPAAAGGAGKAETTPLSAPRPLPAVTALDRGLAVPPSRSRLQDYDATLSLKVKDASALSDATKRALAVARSLGGYASAVHVEVEKGEGDATIRLRVPVGNVQRAVERLSALGTITGESVAIRDLQAGVDAVDKQIARLQKQLAVLRSQEQTATVKRQISSLTTRVERLQRGRASTVRQARLATVDLAMTTREPAKPAKKHESSPLDGAWTALAWMGIGALYGVIVGGPVIVLALLGWLVWRLVRRRRDERLLSETG